MKVPVLIEIPPGYELACDEMRAPRKGELFVGTGGVVTALRDFHSSDIHVIVRPAWVWPAWLKANWLAVDKDGIVFLSYAEPRECGTYWDARGEYTRLHPKWLDFTPPPCDDWRESLRVNPNKKD